MAASGHYLELKQVPFTFEPLDQVESAFFDQSNFQMFCVQHGFTDVKVKGLSEEDNFKITIPARGPVSTIKFSGGSPRVLSVQRRKTSVEFVNIFSEKSTEISLPLKGSNSDVIGFYWIFKNEFIVLITTSSVELFSCNPYRMAFKLVKAYSMNISWAIFSPEELILLVCQRGSCMLHPFFFKSGVSTPITRQPRFEVDIAPTTSSSSSSSSTNLRELRSTLMERDVVIMNLYGKNYIGVIRSPAHPMQGAEILVYQLLSDQPARLSHILGIDVSGRFTLSVVDNLVIVHHQAWKTSMLFDIANGGDQASGVKRHQPVLAPLAITPTKLQVKQKAGKTRALSPNNSSHDSPPHDLNSSPPTVKAILPELYSPKWVFFQPNIIVDAQHGVIWQLDLNLSAASGMMTDKSQVMQFMLMRAEGREVILKMCYDCLEPGRQANLGVLGGMFDQMNHAYKLSQIGVDSDKRYRVVIPQKHVYEEVFAPYVDRRDMPYRFLVAVIVEYVRSLNKLQIVVEHFLFEMVMNLLIENKCFYQLHQFLQYHVISDSKPLACLLLSRELVYPPATQLAMDMFKRLSTADSEIIDILLSRGQLLVALRYVKATDKIDSVSARQFLEAAVNEDDKMLFYTVYKFFEERNLRLRRRTEFPADEKCQTYEHLFRKWFLNSS